MKAILSFKKLKTSQQMLLFFLVNFLISISVTLNSTPYMGLATFSFLMLTMGLIYVKTHLNLHTLFMKTGMAGDILLVLVLEVQRSAINTAAEFSLTPLQQFHILFSTLAVVGYFPTLYFGYKLSKSTKAEYIKLLKKHKPIALITYLFRTIGFILMFSMISHVS